MKLRPFFQDHFHGLSTGKTEWSYRIFLKPTLFIKEIPYFHIHMDVFYNFQFKNAIFSKVIISIFNVVGAHCAQKAVQKSPKDTDKSRHFHSEFMNFLHNILYILDQN